MMKSAAFLRILCLLLFLSATACAGTARVEKTPSPASVRTVQVNGVDLGYRITGQGSPLLMIMGYAGTMDVWDPTLIEELSRNHKVIMFDNRGMGYSSAGNEPLTMSLMASDAAGLLDTLGIKQADVMGWSMGSVITQEMCLKYPNKVRKAVLYATAVDRAPVKAALDRMARKPHKQFLADLFPAEWRDQNPGIYSKLPSPAVPPTRGMIGRQYTAMTTWPGTRDRISAVETPVLLVVGSDDDITPPGQSVDAAGLIRGSWLVRFKGAGHWLMYQTPRGLAQSVNTFLNIDENLLRK